jgi:LysR family glycine cleavage system transcriptional activator
MTRLPPLNALRAFEAAARHGSFAKAATELRVTAAAVSHQVKALEQTLGLKLFKRLPRGLVLTDAGRSYLPGLSEGFDRLARASQGLVGRRLRGALTVSVLPSFGAGWLVPRLPEFRRLYPDIDLLVRSEIRFVDFGSEDVDLAIRYSRSGFKGLRADRLLGEEIFPVCSPSLLNGPHPLRRMEDLRHYTLIHDGAGVDSDPWLLWRPWLQEAGLHDIDPRRGPAFTDSTMIYQAAIAGEGVALGRSAVIGEHLANGRLIRPFAAFRRAEFAYWAVSPAASSDEPHVAAFRRWIVGRARRDGAARPGRTS